MSILKLVFPAYAGVILYKHRDGEESDGVPRVCGGDPLAGMAKKAAVMCSPRKRV